MDSMLGMLGGPATIAAAVPAFAVLGYFYILLDRRSDDSISKGDGQVGIKLVLCGFILLGLATASLGVVGLLNFILGGFKDTGELKSAFAQVAAGGIIGGASFALGLLRTNTEKHPQAARFSFGVVSLAAGLSASMALIALLNAVFLSAGWEAIRGSLAMLITYGVIAVLSILFHAKMSGIVAAIQSAPQAAAGYGHGYSQPGYGQQAGYPANYPQGQAQPGYASPAQSPAGYPQQQGYAQAQPQAGYPQPAAYPAGQAPGGYPPSGGQGGQGGQGGGQGGYGPR